MTIVLMCVLIFASVNLGYFFGRYKAECEFAEILFWLEQTGALNPPLEFGGGR